MDTSDDADLRERLEMFESDELVDKIRKEHLTDEAAALAREILQARNANIPVSVHLQEEKNFRAEEARAKKLWHSRWLVLLHIFAGLALASAVRLLLGGALPYVIALFVGAYGSRAISRKYIAREDVEHSEKVRTLRFFGIALFVVQVVLHSIARIF